jgi:hydroxyacyl-ACP dehydratase HTD2-like protein with hotdog domain
VILVDPGDVLDVVLLPVERGKIREFARATFTEDPVHTDHGAALAAGFADVVATATYSVGTAHYRDQATFVATLGLDIRRVVVGSVSWQYLRTLTAGQELVATRRVESDESREGSKGPLRLVTLVTEFVNSAGEVAVRQREVLIEKGVRA